MDNQRIEKLIFVYNADAGLKNAVMDSLHKVMSPQTYDCKLCELTFGVFTENKRWKDFRENAQVDMVFLHKDEFQKNYASKFAAKYSYPCVLAATPHDLQLFMDSETLNQLESVEELIALVKKGIA